MNIILLIGAVLFGAIIGSFLNALSFRINTGRGVLKEMSGRSRCMHCGHTLAAQDLVPILSFLWLRAKCRYCRSKVSWQYPLVEMLAALLSALIFIEASPLGGLASVFSYVFWFMVWMILLFIVVYDVKHTIIPWSCSGLLAALALIYLFGGFVNPLAWEFTKPPFDMWVFLAGPLLALPLFFTSLVSRGTWMGWGDSALELSLGWLLGLSAGLTALMLAFWSGAIVGIVLLIASKQPASTRRLRRGGYTIKSEIPFAPFLVLGAALAYFFHVDFFSTISLF